MDTLIEQLKAACKEAGEHYFECPEGFEVEDEGDWTQDHKYQSSTDVVKHTETGRCFEIHLSRCGSYHTDWYYSEPELGPEVRKVKKVVETEVWEAVK